MEPKVVHNARSNTEAEIIKSWLEQQGIPAKVFNGEMSGGAFEIIETDPQVLVSEEDFDRALSVIEDFRAELEQTPDMSRVSDAEGQFDWPLCPVCDEMRLARCDQCNEVSSEFSTDESSDEKHMICLACNQSTTLSMLDQCQFCDHDFTGNTPDNVALADVSSDATNTNRVLLLVAGMIVLFIILTIWFVTTTA